MCVRTRLAPDKNVAGGGGGDWIFNKGPIMLMLLCCSLSWLNKTFIWQALVQSSPVCFKSGLCHPDWSFRAARKGWNSGNLFIILKPSLSTSRRDRHHGARKGTIVSSSGRYWHCESVCTLLGAEQKRVLLIRKQRATFPLEIYRFCKKRQKSIIQPARVWLTSTQSQNFQLLRGFKIILASWSKKTA